MLEHFPSLNINHRLSEGQRFKSILPLRLYLWKGKPMNRNGIVILAGAVALTLIAIFRWDSLQASVNYLAPSRPKQTPTRIPPPAPRDQESTRREQALTPEEQPLDPGPAPTYGRTIPTAEIQGKQKRQPAKCMDGSALTVISGDANQTNFRCESGAIGWRTSHR